MYLPKASLSVATIGMFVFTRSTALVDFSIQQQNHESEAYTAVPVRSAQPKSCGVTPAR